MTDRPTTEAPSPAEPRGLPTRVVVDQHGHYWRDYGDYWSMCPVSDENVETSVAVAYERIERSGVEWLVDRAIRRGEITESRGAEILGVSIRALRQLAIAALAERGYHVTRSEGLDVERLKEATEIIEDVALVVEGDDSRPLLDALPLELGDRIATFLNGREYGVTRSDRLADGVLYRVWDRVAALRLTGTWTERKRQVLDIIASERRALSEAPE